MSISETPAPANSAAALVGKRVADVLAPVHLVIAQLLAVGWSATWPRLAGLGWGVVAAAFCGAFPHAFILYGVRRGRWADRHIRSRRQRLLPLLVSLTSVGAGLAALKVLEAPSQLFALVIAMLAGLAALLSLTTVWKASLHAAVAGGSVVILIFVFGGWSAAAAPLLALVCWSRVATGDHSTAQVLVGALLGGLAAGLIFPLVS